jgi:CBS-domain-containing membrane protein
MNSAIERLAGLRVKDVMARNVVEIPCHNTMSDAAECLATHEISGAPVVDEEGHCVGILTAADFMRREQNVGVDVEHALRRDSPEKPFRIDVVADDLVRTHMTPALQTIPHEATLAEAGRVMCAEHIHRLPVLDDQSHVVGVISSLDLVSTMIGILDE